MAGTIGRAARECGDNAAAENNATPHGTSTASGIGRSENAGRPRWVTKYHDLQALHDCPRRYSQFPVIAIGVTVGVIGAPLDTGALAGGTFRRRRHPLVGRRRPSRRR
jgi:hypothetical protein